MKGGAPTEGVIKFDLAYTPGPAPAAHELRQLRAWRAILWRLGLIGQDPRRYGGAGFGNVSRRYGGESRFVISGTQTGALAVLAPEHFTLVTAFDPRINRVEARGPVAPSSESLTHAMLYALDQTIQFVFHVHAPEIWRAQRALDLPATAPDVAYGTPAMAREMERLATAGRLAERRVLVMRGHEDGVIAFGGTAEQAGASLMIALAQALQEEGTRGAST